MAILKPPDQMQCSEESDKTLRNKTANIHTRMNMLEKYCFPRLDGPPEGDKSYRIRLEKIIEPKKSSNDILEFSTLPTAR